MSSSNWLHCQRSSSSSSSTSFSFDTQRAHFAINHYGFFLLLPFFSVILRIESAFTIKIVVINIVNLLTSQAIFFSRIEFKFRRCFILGNSDRMGRAELSRLKKQEHSNRMHQKQNPVHKMNQKINSRR